MTKQRLHDIESGRDRPVQFEITPAMIEAGGRIIDDDGPYFSSDVLASKVYTAMQSVRGSSR